jgi:ribosomal protein S6--L-glutamate ligase
MEVNSTPGLEGIEKTTGKDVAGMIIEYIEKTIKQKNFRPEVKFKLQRA